MVSPRMQRVKLLTAGRFSLWCHRRPGYIISLALRKIFISCSEIFFFTWPFNGVGMYCLRRDTDTGVIVLEHQWNYIILRLGNEIIKYYPT
jgi:hypothetical protein